jgi:hypothetical protein
MSPSVSLRVLHTSVGEISVYERHYSDNQGILHTLLGVVGRDCEASSIKPNTNHIASNANASHSYGTHHERLGEQSQMRLMPPELLREMFNKRP